MKPNFEKRVPKMCSEVRFLSETPVLLKSMKFLGHMPEGAILALNIHGFFLKKYRIPGSQAHRGWSGAEKLSKKV